MKWFHKTPIPYRIKMVERIRMLPPVERFQRIQEAYFNVFNLSSRDVYIDLLTDSGTGAMSDIQWSFLIQGDEAYAGSASYEVLHETIRHITGYDWVLPTHQGRGAERVFFEVMVKPGDVIPSNTHFDTTHANLVLRGALPLDLPVAGANDPDNEEPFKGEMDLDRLKAAITQYGTKRIPFVMLTLTNNAVGGHPVRVEHVRAVKEILEPHGIPLILDAARYAENAYLVKIRDPKWKQESVAAVARAIFDAADGCLMSAKKDGIVPIGGFIALRDEAMYRRLLPALVAYEGFKTYGGMAGHDMAALAVGLKEALNEAYLGYRTQQVVYLVKKLDAAGIPVVKPAGGHAVYIVADRLFEHIPAEQFPGQALVIALYLIGGIRGVEIGSLMLEAKDPDTGTVKRPAHELVRLAIPRRVYHQEHFDFVIEVLKAIAAHTEKWPGFRITEAPRELRHFLAKLEPIGPLPRPET